MKLIISESQYISLKRQVVNEQQATPQSLDIPLTGQTFSSGRFEDQYLNKQQINSVLPQIQEFFKKYPQNQKISVVVNASESKVPNQAGFKPGELAGARGNTVMNYLKSVLPPNAVITVNNLGAQGPDWDRTKSKDDPQYTQFQKIDLKVSLGGDPNNPPPSKKGGTPQFCKAEVNAPGEFLTPQMNFFQVRPIQLGEGTGNMTLTFDTYTIPDIIYFQYNGKTYGDTKFRGGDFEYTRMALGTTLRTVYGDPGNLPKEYGNQTFVPIDPNTQSGNIISYLNAAKDAGWTLMEAKGFFMNLFKIPNQFQNQNIVDLMTQFDNKKINAKTLVKSLGDTVKWGYLTSPIGPSQFRVGPIQKVEGQNELTLVNVAPNGSTGYSISIRCGNQ